MFDWKTRRQKLIEGYAQLIGRYRWDWFATLTFRGSASTSRGKRLFGLWISDIERRDGGPLFRWFRVGEKGREDNNLHYHVLIGGLSADRYPGPWEQRWYDLAGSDGLVDYFDPEDNGIYYMLKTLDPDEDLDFDTNLDDIGFEFASQTPLTGEWAVNGRKSKKRP